VQRFSSTPPVPDHVPKNVPEDWFAPSEALPAKAGLNRFVWNLRFSDPPTLPYSFYGKHIDYIEYTLPDYAIPGQTPRHQPQGPLAAPGKYEVVLTVGSKTYRQPLVVNPDPRVRVSQADLEAQLDLAQKLSDWIATSFSAYNEVVSLRMALAERQNSLAGNSQAKDAVDAATALKKELGEIEDGTNAAPGFGFVNRDLARLMSMIESGDLRPAESAHDVARESCESLKKNLARWRKVNAETLPALNKLLKQYKLAPLPAVNPAADPQCQ
jgi:hypothetical protein